MFHTTLTVNSHRRTPLTGSAAVIAGTLAAIGTSDAAATTPTKGNGSIDGTIRLANAGLTPGTANTIIIPGHGPAGDRAQLAEYRYTLVEIRKNVSTLEKQGKSLAEIVALKPTAKFDAKYGDCVIDPAFFTLLVYTGV